MFLSDTVNYNLSYGLNKTLGKKSSFCCGMTVERNANGVSPYALAIQLGYQEIVDMLDRHCKNPVYMLSSIPREIRER